MRNRPDQLDKMLTDLFLAWTNDIESVPQPMLVSDEEACDLIAAAALRLKNNGIPNTKRIKK